MVALRGLSPRAAVLPLVMCAGITLAGCSSSATESETSAAKSETSTAQSTSATPSAAASTRYDLSRLAEVKDAFPPDFTPGPSSAPRKVSPKDAYLVGNTVSYGRPFTVDPPECHALLDPVDGQAGAETMGVGAGEGPDKRGLVVSAYDPVTVPVALPSTGCDRMTFHVEDDAVRTEGTAERLAAPAIDGAQTSAVKINVDGYQYVEYYYVAILDNRVFAQVWARMDPDFQPEPLLPDLLSEAVTAIRG